MNHTQHHPAPTMTVADVAAHLAASHVRPRANFTICHECQGAWSPQHVCPPRITTRFGICDFCGKPAVAGHACATSTPTGGGALHRLEIWAAHVLRDQQNTEATA